uniref:Uncharacterized protein n=1 Tax=Cyprinus carpio TaxID=7962 RepID=A0A8C2H6J6_CYPCA
MIEMWVDRMDNITYVIQDKFCGIINIRVEVCMLMSHFEEPKLTDDEEPPTEQVKKRKLVSFLPWGKIKCLQDSLTIYIFGPCVEGSQFV